MTTAEVFARNGQGGRMLEPTLCQRCGAECGGCENLCESCHQEEQEIMNEIARHEMGSDYYG